MKRSVMAVALAPALALALAATGCSQTIIEGPVGEADAEADSGSDDGTSASDVPADGPAQLGCDPAHGDADCPEGLFCHATAWVCTECVATVDRCTAAGERERCEKPEVLGFQQVEGGFFEPLPCLEDEACFPDPAGATCEPLVCEPGASRCVEGQVEQCNAYGTNQFTEPCPPGKACYSGACQLIRHNVLVIVDTSGSMNEHIVDNAPPLELPACDYPIHGKTPVMKMTLAKSVFRENLDDTVGEYVTFGLQRFPQREAAGKQETCTHGLYYPLDAVTGDNGKHFTEDGDWFETNSRDVLLVPFPTRVDVDNRGSIFRWMDYKETLAPHMNKPCEAKGMGDPCDDGRGRCDYHEEELVCWYHDNDELRGGGDTPIGKSLFYAGEYFRRYVLIDGKPCDTSGDCPSAGYLCCDGVCKDPYKHCKENHILVFSDGKETLFPDPKESFFNPRVQAKRLRYGLTCEDDDDCRGGARCEAGLCLGMYWTESDTDPDQLVQKEQNPSIYATFASSDQDANALSSPGGGPISIVTSIVAVADDPTDPNNAVYQLADNIANAGGGTAFKGDWAQPEVFKAQLRQLMDIKYKCAADDLGDACGSP